MSKSLKRAEQLLKSTMSWFAEQRGVNLSEVLEAADGSHREILYLRVEPLQEFRDKLNSSDRKTRREISRHLYSTALCQGQGAVLGGGRAVRPQIKEFLETNSKESGKLIDQLVGTPFKSPDASMIDGFIEGSMKLGISQKSFGAKVASVILSSAFPDEYVDFVTKRWCNFAETFCLEEQEIIERMRSRGKQSPPYSEKLAWAGNVANRFAELPTFGKIFNKSIYQHENWVVAGIVALCHDKFQNETGEITMLEIVETISEGKTPEPLTLQNIDEDIGNHFEVGSDNSYPEGAVKQILVNSYERNRSARKAAIRIHGVECKVCGKTMESIYGKVAAGLVEIHHAKQLSKLKKGYKVDPAKDLVPLCPNCHAISHLNDPPYSVEQIRKMIEES